MFWVSKYDGRRILCIKYCRMKTPKKVTTTSLVPNKQNKCLEVIKLPYYTLKNHVPSNCYNLKNLKHFFFNTNYLFTTKSVFLYKILLGIHYTEYTRSLVKIFIVNGHFHTPFSFPYLCYIASRNRILVPTKPY